jgi:ATP-dependent DNA helicase RecG
LTVVDAQELVWQMRSQQSDLPNAEAKLALGGLPDSLNETISAFANLPGGGTILLGIDESSGFTPVNLPDAAKLKANLASRSRQAFDPPVAIEIFDANVEGTSIIVGVVRETDPSAKPCVVKRTGKAYMRSWDGDFELSSLEIQGMLAARTRPRFDSAPAAGATREHLDRRMVDDFINTARSSDSGFARLPDDDDLLKRVGVLTEEGLPTVAGILALGIYPQQFFPNFVIQAAVLPGPNDPANIRARDVARFSGPIPVMLDDATSWVALRSTHELVTRDDGQVTDRFDLPQDAVRELLANSLVHRDLADWSWSRAIELRITDSTLRLSNPGGLFGVTVARLLTNQLTSARNETLVRICQFVRTRDGRVVEALATGIPTILQATIGAGMPAPDFFDQAVSFTAVLHRQALPSGADTQLTLTESQVARILLDGPHPLTAIAAQLGLTTATARKHLQTLRDKGVVELIGGRGQRSSYRLRSSFSGAKTT